MSDSESEMDTDSVLRLELEAIKLNERKVQIELKIAKRKKRKRSQTADLEEDNDSDHSESPPKKKKRSKSNPPTEHSPAPPSSSSSRSPSPSPGPSSTHSGSKNSKSSSNSFPEYFKGRRFNRPLKGMILDRPSSDFKTYETSPWGLRSDKDGWNQYLKFIRTSAPDYFDLSKGWRGQSNTNRKAFLKSVTKKYPILAHQNTQFTTTAAASRHLHNESRKKPSSKSPAQTVTKSRQQASKKTANQVSLDLSRSSSPRGISSTPISPSADLKNDSQKAPASTVIPQAIDPALTGANGATLWQGAHPAAPAPFQPIFSAGGMFFGTPEMTPSLPAPSFTPDDPAPLNPSITNVAPAQSRSRRHMPYIVDAQFTIPAPITDSTHQPTVPALPTTSVVSSTPSIPPVLSSSTTLIAPSAPGVPLAPSSSELLAPADPVMSSPVSTLSSPGSPPVSSSASPSLAPTPNISSGRKAQVKESRVVAANRAADTPAKPKRAAGKKKGKNAPAVETAVARKSARQTRGRAT